MRRLLARTVLAFTLAACAEEEGGAPPPPDGGGGAGGSRCGIDEALIDGLCRPLCPDGLPPDDEGLCGQFCRPDCDGKACLADDGCGAPCEAACVKVSNVTVPAQEPDLRRDMHCFAWDAPAASFLLHGGRRRSIDAARLGPGQCRLLGAPDDPVDRDGVVIPRAEACALPPACWTEGCTAPDGWVSVEPCASCYLEDSWRLAEDAEGAWRWTKLPAVEPVPRVLRELQCRSAGSGGVIARGVDEGRGWHRWRWSDGGWSEQAPDDRPAPARSSAGGVVAWQPDCGRAAGCELFAGGCSPAGIADPASIAWVEADGAPHVEPLPEELWRRRVAAAGTGAPGGAWFFGGTDEGGSCWATFNPATMHALNDLLFWDGASLQLVDAPGRDLVTPRERAELALLGDRLVLFGGLDPGSETTEGAYPGELCEYEPTRGWSCRYMAEVDYDRASGTPTATRLPYPRTAHALASGFGHDGRPVVVLFGGSEETQRGDTWVIELP